MNTQTIAHFATGIGNFILYIPALKALAEMDPSGQIDICTDAHFVDSRREGLMDLWSKCPFIQNSYSRSDTFEKRYKVWFWTNWTTHGDAKDLFSAMNNYPQRPWDQRKLHEIDFYFNIVKDFYGYTGYRLSQYCPVADGPILKKVPKRICFCNGGFSDLAKFKRWPGFKSLSPVVKKYFSDIEIVGVGIGNELEGVELDENYVDKLSLTKTAKVISQCDLMVTTDTGNMHIADALGVPIIVLWGGSSIEKNRPLNAQNRIINLEFNCQPCQMLNTYRECVSVDCINKITVSEVMFYIRNFFMRGTFDG